MGILVYINNPTYIIYFEYWHFQHEYQDFTLDVFT